MKNTWSLIAGLAGLFLPVPFIPSILAIRLGRRAEQEEGPSGTARAGIILGWIGVVLWSIACCAIAAFSAWRMAAIWTAAMPEIPAEEPALPPTPALSPMEPAPAGSAYLGIRCEDRGGARVAGVIPGSPAEKAGLRAGDVILALDTHGVVGCADLAEEVGKRTPGQTVTLKVWRDGKTVQMLVTLGAR